MAAVQPAGFDERLPLPAAFRVSEKLSAAGGRGAKEAYPEVDWIKGVGIVVVVLIHSLPTSLFGTRISDVEDWIGQVTRFAVPGFLACSGYLFAASRGSRGLGAVRQRLQRLLVPYLAFSLFGWALDAFYAMAGGPTSMDPTPLPLKLLFGSVVGPYYYVFLIVTLVFATPMFARLPPMVIYPLAVLAVVLQFAHEGALLPPLSWFWMMRSPTRSFGPFLVGWCVCLQRKNLRRRLEAGARPACVAILAALLAAGGVGIALVPAFSRARLFLETAQCYFTLGLFLVATLGRSPAPELVQWLSEASYPIYLGHLYFVFPILASFPYVDGTFQPLRILLAWAAGLGNSAAVVLVGRQLLGASLARKVLG